jgi:hypothetical protein
MQMNIFETVYARIQLVQIEKILWRGWLEGYRSVRWYGYSPMAAADIPL